MSCEYTSLSSSSKQRKEHKIHGSIKLCWFPVQKSSSNALTRRFTPQNLLSFTNLKQIYPHFCFTWGFFYSSAMSIESSSSDVNIKGIPTHGGRYVQYNVYGNLFEVSRKYVPPIRPVGRGAYGIVWLVPFTPFICAQLGQKWWNFELGCDWPCLGFSKTWRKLRSFCVWMWSSTFF